MSNSTPLLQPSLPIALRPRLPELAPSLIAGGASAPDVGGRTFLMQPWITLRGSVSSPNAVTQITQDDALWLDLSRYADAAFWVDVCGVTNAAGNGAVTLSFESSPSTDETGFRAVAPALTLAPSTDGLGNVVPSLVKTTRSSITAPLTRWTRWRVTATGTSGTWEVSFRIRGAGGMSRFWTPTDIAGCQLWFRSDLGITTASGKVSGWTDLTGKQRDLVQGLPSNQPTWSASTINGQPTVDFGGGQVLTTGSTSFNLGPYALAMVCTPQVGTNGMFWTRSSGATIADTLYGSTFCSMYVSRLTGTDSCRDRGGLGATTWGQTLPATGALLLVQFDGTANGHTLRVNGQLASDVFTHAGYGDPGTGTVPSKFTVGGTDSLALFASTKVAEIAMFDAPLSPAALASLEEYLRRRYALY